MGGDGEEDHEIDQLLYNAVQCLWHSVCTRISGQVCPRRRQRAFTVLDSHRIFRLQDDFQGVAATGHIPWQN